MLMLLVLLASDPGFGGASPQAEAPCRIFVDGAWASCDAFLEQAAPPAPRASVPPPIHKTPVPRSEKSAAPRELEPFQTTRRKARVVPMETSGPLSDALNRLKKEAVETPLSRLRDETEALERTAEDIRNARRKTRGDDVLYDQALADAEAAHAQADAILNDVEVYALRLRERCQTALPENEDGERPWASPAALTVGRPLSVTEPEVRAALAELDAPECERTDSITDEHIERFRRFYVLEARIAASQGYGDIAERRRMERERAAIGRMRRGMDLSAPATAAVRGTQSLAPAGFESSGTGYKSLGGTPGSPP